MLRESQGDDMVGVGEGELSGGGASERSGRERVAVRRTGGRRVKPASRAFFSYRVRERKTERVPWDGSDPGWLAEPRAQRTRFGDRRASSCWMSQMTVQISR